VATKCPRHGVGELYICASSAWLKRRQSWL
jgi:hypothetical protein